MSQSSNSTRSLRPVAAPRATGAASRAEHADQRASCDGSVTAGTVDGETLERARAGDRAAHAALYVCFAPRVFALARRMTASSARAEDILQDTFVEVIRNIGRYRCEAEIGTWISRIAINKCLSLMRSRWWTSRLDIDETDLLAGPDDAAGADAMLELEQLLDRLPPVARAVVWLHDGEGFTHQEIGALMGKTASFSKSQLQRAHRRLRAALERSAQAETNTICTSAIETI